MWHKLKNFSLGLRTYDLLSPDCNVRRQVNRALRHRPALSQDEWFETFCKKEGIAYPVAVFAYTHLECYSGLSFSRVLLSDRLVDDLCWTSVCWFDWELSLCDDFYSCFEIDLSDDLEGLMPLTIGDLISFLNCHWSVQHSTLDKQ